jgi:hypothetical protein
VSVKGADPLVAPLMSAGETPIVGPLAGIAAAGTALAMALAGLVVDSTVST